MKPWPPAEWPDPVRRGVRTFFQAFVGNLVVAFAGPAFAPGEVPNLATVQKILVAAIMAGIIAVVSFAHNALEDTSSIPLKPVLKRPSLKQEAEGR